MLVNILDIKTILLTKESHNCLMVAFVLIHIAKPRAYAQKLSYLPLSSPCLRLMCL